jgi:hypothetical protein
MHDNLIVCENKGQVALLVTAMNRARAMLNRLLEPERANIELARELPVSGIEIPCGPGRPEPLFDRPSIVGQRLDGPMGGPALNVGNDRFKLP